MCRFIRLFGLLAITVLAVGASEAASIAETPDDPTPEIVGLASEATPLLCEATGCEDCKGEACTEADVDWASTNIREACGRPHGSVSICCDGPAVRMYTEVTCYD